MLINNIHSNYENHLANTKANFQKSGFGTFQKCLTKASQSGKFQNDTTQISTWNSADDTPVITEAGKKSKGDQTLTDVQKQYLKEKYNVLDLPQSKQDELLKELTNMGALSYQDYKMSHLSVISVSALPMTVCLGKTEDLEGLSPNNQAEKYRELLLFEETGRKVTKQSEGTVAAAQYDPYIGAHRKIYNLLQSLS